MKPKLVPITKVPHKQITSQLLAGNMRSLLDQVRVRAYELFELRGRSDGQELDDWVQAEIELGLLPDARVKENDAEIRLRVNCPNCGAGDLKVYAEPQALTVVGTSQKTPKSVSAPQADALTHSLFRRCELPGMINTDSVRAAFQKGVLEVVAKRAESERPAETPSGITIAAAAGSGLSGGLDLTLDPRKAFIPGPHAK